MSVSEILFIVGVCGAVRLLISIGKVIQSREFQRDLARLRQNRALRRAARRRR